MRGTGAEALQAPTKTEAEKEGLKRKHLEKRSPNIRTKSK